MAAPLGRGVRTRAKAMDDFLYFEDVSKRFGKVRISGV
jgi:hypothetical protein